MGFLCNNYNKNSLFSYHMYLALILCNCKVSWIIPYLDIPIERLKIPVHLFKNYILDNHILGAYTNCKNASINILLGLGNSIYIICSDFTYYIMCNNFTISFQKGASQNLKIHWYFISGVLKRFKGRLRFRIISIKENWYVYSSIFKNPM